MKGCAVGCFGVFVGLVVVPIVVVVGAIGLVASTGLVAVPILTGLVFRTIPEPKMDYAFPSDLGEERRARMSALGSELRDFFEFGIRPESGDFKLTEQDVADILAELVFDRGEGGAVRSAGVNLAPDQVSVYLVIDPTAAGEIDTLIPGALGFMSLRPTSIELLTELKYVEGTLDFGITHVQVGRAPRQVGRLLAFVGSLFVEGAVSRVPVDAAAEELVVGDGEVRLRFKSLSE